MIEHVVQVARSVAGEVVILADGPVLPQSLVGIETLADVEPGRGPLAGLCSLLAHASSRWGLLLACDLPRLERDPLERLLGAVSPKLDAVAFADHQEGARYQACCALYHPRVQAVALKELQTGRGSLQSLLRAIRTRRLVPSRRQAAMLADVDTAEDLERFRKAGH